MSTNAINLTASPPLVNGDARQRAYNLGQATYRNGIERIPIQNSDMQLLVEQMPDEQAIFLFDAYFEGYRHGEICPRCGKPNMKPRLKTNALSRTCEEYICDQCGTHEALQNAFGTLTPRQDWPLSRQTL